MEFDRQDMRRAAAKSFLESLDKLQTTLNDTVSANEKSARRSESGSASKAARSGPGVFDMRDLEEAVADIDHFFEERSAKPTDSRE